MRPYRVRTVGVDAHVLTGKYQGSRTWLEGVLSELPNVDHANRYILYSEDPAASRRVCEAPNMFHHKIPLSGPAARLLLFWPQARRRDGFDVLVTQYIAPPLLAGPQVVVVHDLLFESHPHFFPLSVRLRNRALVRLSAQRAHRVLAVSEYTRGELVRRYGVPKERILLAPNAISPSPQPIQPATIRGAFVLFVGRIEPRKNLHLLLDALDRLGRPGLRLVVAGKADFGANATLARLRGRSDVEHLQDVDAESLAALYHNAAMLVLPSEGEGFGIPVLEALARGAPVVCSNVTALPEVAGNFARFFDPHAEDAPGALAEAIASVLDRPPRHDASALAAHLARFTWRRAAEATVEAVTFGGQSRL
ncbi:MAG: glycosyltransferase family 4 protein [Methylocella sp.]